MSRQTIPLLLLTLLGAPVLAQESSPAGNRFLLSGYGFVTYTDSDSTADGGSFNVGYAPIFLYRLGDQFLFEAELEFEYEDEELEIEVEYAQIDWLANDYLTVVAGKSLTPFGTFIERIHPAWVNKLPTAPLPFQHGQSLVPFSQTGLQLRGGAPLGDGNPRLTYSLYVTNGFRASEHHEEGEAGEEDHGSLAAEGDDHEDDEDELIFLDGSSFNGNGDLALGGRVSILPVRGLEVGASFLSGSYDEEGSLDATMVGVDVAYHHDLFDVRAEWLDTTTERGLAADGDPLHDQEVQGWYLQPSLRLSVLPVYFLNPVEIVARVGNLDWGGGERDQISIGCNYYFTGASVLRLAWERTDETGLESEDALQVMFALGF